MIDYIKISVGKWMTQIVSIIFFIVGARYLSLDEYGVFGILSVFIAISNYLSRETLESLVVSKKINFISAVRISIEIVIVTIIIVFIGCKIFVSKELYQNYIYLLIVIITFHWISAPLRAKLVELKLYTKYSFVFALSSLTSVIFGIYFLEMKFGVFALLFQQVILSAMILAISFYFTTRFKINSGKFSRADYKPFFNILPSSIIFVISARLDVLIVSNYLGLASAGVYTFCRRVFQIISDIFVGGFDKLLLKGHYKISLKSYYLIQVVVFLGFYFTSILSIYLIPILLGNKWIITSQYLLIMSSGATYFVSIVLLRSKYIINERYSLLLKVRVFELFISIIVLLPIDFFPFLWIAAVYFSFKFFIISNIMAYQILEDKFIGTLIGFSFSGLTYVTYLYLF